MRLCLHLSLLPGAPAIGTLGTPHDLTKLLSELRTRDARGERRRCPDHPLVDIGYCGSSKGLILGKKMSSE